MKRILWILLSTFLLGPAIADDEPKVVTKCVTKSMVTPGIFCPCSRNGTACRVWK